MVQPSVRHPVERIRESVSGPARITAELSADVAGCLSLQTHAPEAESNSAQTTVEYARVTSHSICLCLEQFPTGRN